ncbi:hypothetical protein GCM10027262_71570 [Nocardia tengchongensis]
MCVRPSPPRPDTVKTGRRRDSRPSAGHPQRVGHQRGLTGAGHHHVARFPYIAVELYELLVLARGWSLDRYAQWTAHAITAALI